MAMLCTEPPRRSMIGRQVRRSNVRPWRKTTGTPVPVTSYASPLGCCMTPSSFVSFHLYRNDRCNIVSRVGRPKEHDAATGEALLDAAEHIVERGGMAALSVRRVADRAGTTTRAVYAVFG